MSDHGLIGGARWIEFQKFSDTRGSLTPIESARDVPFPIVRLFYFYDVPVGDRRGSHAHRAQEQVIVCIAGSFDVLLDDGMSKEKVCVSRPWSGLYVPPMLWAEQLNFDGGTVGLVLASDHFDEADYIRSYDDYLQMVGGT
jgi:dTDP-4-dehydrorhamnose 3,5-epimerase-like enzyme